MAALSGPSGAASPQGMVEGPRARGHASFLLLPLPPATELVADGGSGVWGL